MNRSTATLAGISWSRAVMQAIARSLWMVAHMLVAVLIALLASAVSTTPAVGREDCEVMVRPYGRGVVNGHDVQAFARGWLPAAIQLDDAIAELSPREEAWLAGEMKQIERIQKAIGTIEYARQKAKRDASSFRIILQALADGKQDQISPVRRVLFMLDQLVESDTPFYLARLILDGELSRKVVFWELFQDLTIVPRPDTLVANIRAGRDIFARDLVRCTLPALIGTEFFTR